MSSDTAIVNLTIAVNRLRETFERLIVEEQVIRPTRATASRPSKSIGELRVWLEDRRIPYPPEATREGLQALYDASHPTSEVHS